MMPRGLFPSVFGKSLVNKKSLFNIRNSNWSFRYFKNNELVEQIKSISTPNTFYLRQVALFFLFLLRFDGISIYISLL